MPLKHTILPIIVLLLASCTPSDDPAKIIRLDLAAADSMPDARRHWLEIYNATNSSAPYETVAGAFAQITADELPPLDSVENVLGHALHEGKYKLYGLINPFYTPVAIRRDSVSQTTEVFIGLNHYLGPTSKAYSGFPEYQRRLKSIEYIPVDIVKALLIDKSKDIRYDNNVINNIIYLGAVNNRVLKMLPDGTPEARVLGMTQEEYDWCVANEHRIWQKLIEDNLLYSTDAEVMRKLFKPQPATAIINANAPGNTVQFTGLQIARAYERATGKDAAPDASYLTDRQTLIKSKYDPQKGTSRK